MKIIFIIALNFIVTCAIGQDIQNTCNCVKTPIDAIPEISKRKIVNSDTVYAHHSYCFIIISTDINQKAVVNTRLCNEKPTDSFLLNFYDPRTLGTRIDTWFDTSGRSIYKVVSKNDIVKECYWYHYRQKGTNYDYTFGYKNGKLFKEIYTWDEYGASYKQRIIITAKTITTIIHTEEQDKYGYYIQKTSVIPNKTGKVE